MMVIPQYTVRARVPEKARWMTMDGRPPAPLHDVEFVVSKHDLSVVFGMLIQNGASEIHAVVHEWGKTASGSIIKKTEGPLP